jgi:hypothetical protein
MTYRAGAGVEGLVRTAPKIKPTHIVSTITGKKVFILFNIVDKCEQRGQQNIVQSWKQRAWHFLPCNCFGVIPFFLYPY